MVAQMMIKFLDDNHGRSKLCQIISSRVEVMVKLRKYCCILPTFRILTKTYIFYGNSENLLDNFAKRQKFQNHFLA